ncbi:MAG TPA: ABC-F family ATP-binding cassette domain-containing protein, partial [Acidimicrobiales bacterium]|nr:ABC-F family ATP-binding cassette domain-containing protein [Acidimicrobiales bacterium]
MILVDVEKATVRRPDRPLFENLSVTVRAGDRLGVVGRNGSGKSTLLRILAGAGEPEEGVVRRGRDVRVGYLDQEPVLPAGTVRDAVGQGPSGPSSGERSWEAAAILDRLGMAALAGDDVSTLSGGQTKRVALARVLVQEVDLLVLDEPTNHLDVEAIAWLEARLAAFRGGLVLVTHDRHVLDRVTTRILEIEGTAGYVHDGGYASYLADRAERAERDASTEAVRRNLAKSELAWLRRGAPARTRKPKARIAAATAIVEGGPAPARAAAPELAAASRGVTTPRLGDLVVTLTGVGHRWGDGDWLFRGVDLDLEPGGRLGILGPNGSGKTTLLEIVEGRLAPAEGEVRTAATVRLGYYRQAGVELDAAQRVREAVAAPATQPNWEQARLMERFLFDNDIQQAPIGTLSGGERRRLQLLLVLTRMPNVLLLDEPTNDLDLDTLRALEDHLESWPGSLVVVSHDRALLERTVEDVLVLDGRGKATMALNGYAGYVTEHAKARPPGTAKPAPAREAPGPAAAPKLRSPSTLRRLIGVAERAMVEAEATRDRLAAELAALDPADHVALTATAQSLAEAEAALGAAEER